VPDTPVEEKDYPIVMDEEQEYTRTDRRLNSISLNGSKDGNQTITIPTPLKVYSKVETPAFTAMAGETLSPVFGYTGTWMHGYVYLDRGQDGSFDATLGENCTIPEGSDIMAFSFAETVFDSGNGYNSAGQWVYNLNVLNPPAFVLPADLENGFYRMRYKIDWAWIDPAGRPEDGNGTIQNGGAICDVRINVHGETCNVKAKADNGTISIGGKTISESHEHKFGTPLAVNAVPDAGYILEALHIRHGHNLDDERIIHGVVQYEEESIPGSAIEGYEYIIPAESVDGDIHIEAVFAKSEENSIKDAVQDKTVDINVTDGGITVTAVQPTTVDILDLAGRRIYSGTVEKTQKFSLENGIYIVNGIELLVK
jgi:hypothetical protein